MIPVKWLRGEVAVIGARRSGASAARLLNRAGGRIYLSDSSTDAMSAATQAELRNHGIDVQLGSHDLSRIARASLVVVSPGVPPDAPPLGAARASGATVVSEVEVGLRLLGDARVIAVTGTNGKSTTTALAGHLLRSMGYVARDAGNIGTPVCEIALTGEPPAWLALELSSFQLHDTPSLRPTVGVLTNLSPDHLDRYPSIDAYYADKRLLFANASSDSRWVINLDDGDSLRLVDGVPGSRSYFALEREGADAFLDRSEGRLLVHGRTLAEQSALPLLGEHNVANVLAAALAVAVADPVHESNEMWSRICDGVASFRGLPHRLEVVCEVGSVLWINDSKATNVMSALMAVRAMTRPTVLLLGGKHKGESYKVLAQDIARGCRLVIAYGAAAELIERDLGGSVPIRRMGSDFGAVLAEARSAALPGDAVLLAPACSSFDMFNGYEERGDIFRETVLGMRVME